MLQNRQTSKILAIKGMHACVLEEEFAQQGRTSISLAILHYDTCIVLLVVFLMGLKSEEEHDLAQACMYVLVCVLSGRGYTIIISDQYALGNNKHELVTGSISYTEARK